jgi:hypothetical protein
VWVFQKSYCNVTVFVVSTVRVCLTLQMKRLSVEFLTGITLVYYKQMTRQFQVLFDVSYAGCIASVIDVWMRVGNWWNNAEWKPDVFLRKACLSAILPFTYPAWISVGSNSGLRRERPTTVRSIARHGRPERKTTVCSQFSYLSLFVQKLSRSV